MLLVLRLRIYCCLELLILSTFRRLGHLLFHLYQFLSFLRLILTFYRSFVYLAAGANVECRLPDFTSLGSK